MKCESTTFFCDAPGCSAKFTSVTSHAVEAYLALVAGGWEVKQLAPWRHNCPVHRSTPGKRSES